MVKVCIMQPTFLPYYGYFKLMQEADIVVFLDNVQFSKQSWQQRNKVLVNGVEQWLTLPVKQKMGQLIKDVEIADKDKLDKIISTVATSFKYVLQPVTTENMARINRIWIEQLAKKLGIKAAYYSANSLDTSDILEICKKLGATEYISTGGSRVYFDDNLENKFLCSRITVAFRDFEPDYSIVQYLDDKEYLKGKGLI